MKTSFRNTIVCALVAALGVAAIPSLGVSAAGDGQISNERLERIWARQLRIYERMRQTDEIVERVENLIDRANENGKDVSAVQAALDAFKATAKAAQPIYENAGGIISAHPGFDGNGKVTDTKSAQDTVAAMREKLKEIRDAVEGTRRALHEAIRAFREANPRSQPSSTPAGGRWYVQSGFISSQENRSVFSRV